MTRKLHVFTDMINGPASVHLFHTGSPGIRIVTRGRCLTLRAYHLRKHHLVDRVRQLVPHNFEGHNQNHTSLLLNKDRVISDKSSPKHVQNILWHEPLHRIKYTHTTPKALRLAELTS